MNKQQEPRLRFQGFTGEWEERVLGKIFEISSASRVLKEQWQKEGVPFFRTSDVIAAFKGESNEEAFISFELFEDLAKKSGRPQKDDLLVTGGGSIGIPFLIQNDQPIYFKDADLLWLKSAGKINGSFLFYSFLSNKFKSYLKSISHTGTISHYTIIQAKFTPIALPSLPEQTHLGLFFRRLDSQIAESRAVLEKSRQLKKAMLAKMFPANGEKIPKIRFKGFHGEWECRKLGEISNFAKGKGLSKSSIDSNGNIPCILYGELYTKYDCYINKVFSSTNEKIENPILTKSNDVLLPTSDVTPNGLAKACSIYFDDIVLGGDILVIRSTEMFGLFFAHYVESNPFMIIEKATGTTVFHIYEKDLRDIVLLLPSYEEQTAIGNFFRQLDETIALQSAEVEKLNQLKKGLLAAMLV